MRQINHWIGGAASPAAGRPGSVWDPATGEQQAEVVAATAAETRRRWLPPGRLPRLAGGVAVPPCGGDVPVPRAHRRQPQGDRRLVSAEHGKTVADALGEVARGIENVEFALWRTATTQGRVQ